MSPTNERTPLNGSAPVAVAPARNRTQTQSRVAKIAVGGALALALGLVFYASQSGSSSTDAPPSSAGQQAPPAGDSSPVTGALINGTEPWSCGTSAYDAGYIKLANKKDDHYFYWFVESSSADPSKDPLVLWLTGGPGVSSMSALLTENGPCSINEDLSTKANPYSWSNQANVIWLDQPTGVGFSYTNAGAEDADFDELNVGENIYWFLQGFLEKHPEFDGREFFITGESYAGHYIPGAAHYIWQQNKKPLADGVKLINLQGIAIGNGHTDPVIQYQHSVDMAFNRYNVTLLSDKQIERMRKDQVLCIAATKQCQATPRLGTFCVDAQQCWSNKLIGPYLGAKRNSYDLRKPCTSTVQVGAIAVCGFNFSTVDEYLALPTVRDALHVDVPKWVEVNADVMMNFVTSGDFSFSYSSYVADLLNDDIRVLIYAGDADMMCNWAGNEAWTKALKWKGSEGFNAAEERVFVAQDPVVADAPPVEAGLVRSFKNFAFLRVWEAGHMVPMDQPAVSLEMINKFFKNEEL